MLEGHETTDLAVRIVPDKGWDFALGMGALLARPMGDPMQHWQTAYLWKGNTLVPAVQPLDSLTVIYRLVLTL